MSRRPLALLLAIALGGAAYLGSSPLAAADDAATDPVVIVVDNDPPAPPPPSNPEPPAKAAPSVDPTPPTNDPAPPVDDDAPPVDSSPSPADDPLPADDPAPSEHSPAPPMDSVPPADDPGDAIEPAVDDPVDPDDSDVPQPGQEEATEPSDQEPFNDGFGFEMMMAELPGKNLVPDPNLRRCIASFSYSSGVGLSPDDPNWPDSVTQADFDAIPYVSRADLTCRNVSDLTGLDNMAGKGIYSLNMYGSSVSDLGPLRALTDVVILQIESSNLASLAPLASMTGLADVTLWAWGTSALSLSPLAGLNLGALALDGPQFRDISPLAALSGLYHFRLTNTKVSDITALAGMPNLEWDLNLSNNQIKDVSPLAGNTKVDCLWLDNNQIVDVSPLATMPGLMLLGLANNKITDVSPLAALPLMTLNLSGNHITDISSVPDQGWPWFDARSQDIRLTATAGSTIPWPTVVGQGGSAVEWSVVAGAVDHRGDTLILANKPGVVVLSFTAPGQRFDGLVTITVKAAPSGATAPKKATTKPPAPQPAPLPEAILPEEAPPPDDVLDDAPEAGPAPLHPVDAGERTPLAGVRTVAPPTRPPWVFGILAVGGAVLGAWLHLQPRVTRSTG